MPATAPPLSVSQAAWTAVTASSYCNKIRVTENRGASGYPNGDFLVNKTPALDKNSIQTPPASGANSVRIQSGAQYIFEAPRSGYSPDVIVGYIKMVGAVSTTFDQDESTQ